MNTQNINHLVEKLIKLDSLEESRFEDTLDAKLIKTEQNPVSTFYEFNLKDSVLEHGEIRLAKSGEWALIIIQPPDDSEILEEDLDLDPWGEIAYLDINPDIPPEGMIAYTYESNGVLISFQFHEGSRKLSSVVIEWGESE